ncbi:MAG TPA: DNA gyrase inhibitor YacG [Stellaceae bacterium]|nr:DNA gyrase inhibitor YacG [Stellaceae bacterium]
MTEPRHKRQSGGTCPTCGKPVSERHRPFCSQRCATIDLARWLTGGYRVPTDETPEDSEGREPGPPARD